MSTVDFEDFAAQINQNWTKMSAQELFVLDINPDDIWANYLASFPEGTNPIFRERTEHDCSCCRNFIKRVGNVVALHEISDKHERQRLHLA